MTDEDIKDLEGFSERLVLAIKAPKGTKMALPYPDPAAADPGYQIYLQSPDGPVDIYAVQMGMVDDGSQDGGFGGLSAAGQGHKSEGGADPQSMFEFSSADDHHCIDQDSGFSDFYVCPNFDT